MLLGQQVDCSVVGLRWVTLFQHELAGVDSTLEDGFGPIPPVFSGAQADSVVIIQTMLFSWLVQKA